MAMTVRADGKVTFQEDSKGATVSVVSSQQQQQQQINIRGGEVTPTTGKSGAMGASNSYGWGPTLEALYGADAKDSTLVYRVVLSKLNSAENGQAEVEQMSSSAQGEEEDGGRPSEDIKDYTLLAPAVQRQRSFKRYMSACELLSTRPNKKICRLCFGMVDQNDPRAATTSVTPVAPAAASASTSAAATPRKTPNNNETSQHQDDPSGEQDGHEAGALPVVADTPTLADSSSNRHPHHMKVVAETQVPSGILDLSTEYLGVRGFIAFLMILPRIPSDTGITKINLSKLRIDTPQVTLLAQALSMTPQPYHQPITEVDLSENPFSSVGAQALVECVQKVPGLIDIKVEGVEMVGSAHRKLMSALEHNRNRIENKKQQQKMLE